MTDLPLMVFDLWSVLLECEQNWFICTSHLSQLTEWVSYRNIREDMAVYC